MTKKKLCAVADIDLKKKKVCEWAWSSEQTKSKHMTILTSQIIICTSLSDFILYAVKLKKANELYPEEISQSFSQQRSKKKKKKNRARDKSETIRKVIIATNYNTNNEAEKTTNSVK